MTADGPEPAGLPVPVRPVKVTVTLCSPRGARPAAGAGHRRLRSEPRSPSPSTRLSRRPQLHAEAALPRRTFWNPRSGAPVSINSPQVAHPCFGGASGSTSGASGHPHPSHDPRRSSGPRVCLGASCLQNFPNRPHKRLMFWRSHCSRPPPDPQVPLAIGSQARPLAGCSPNMDTASTLRRLQGLRHFEATFLSRLQKIRDY